MSQPWISRGRYSPVLDTLETERAIQLIKDFFQCSLAHSLRLRRVTAPFFVKGGTGINDDLNGIEKPVSFSAPGLGGERIEIVQSLAKWKRLALRDLKIRPGFGIYTDMNALRPDEIPDAMHSLYVDQWDWEKAIRPEDRNLEYLKRTVRRIYGAVRSTESFMRSHFPRIKPVLPEEIIVRPHPGARGKIPRADPRPEGDRALPGAGRDLRHRGRRASPERQASRRPGAGL